MDIPVVRLLKVSKGHLQKADLKMLHLQLLLLLMMKLMLLLPLDEDVTSGSPSTLLYLSATRSV